MTSPAGARDGQTLRLRGKGQPGLGGGQPGNDYVEIRVSAHPIFTRAGNDIETEVEWSIGFDEAILGAKVEVPTLSGRVAMGGPKRATTGQQLRLKGTGIARANGAAGDQYVRLKIFIPTKVDAAMKRITLEWRDQIHGLRRELRGLADAVHGQPDVTQQAIVATYRRLTQG